MTDAENEVTAAVTSVPTCADTIDLVAQLGTGVAYILSEDSEGKYATFFDIFAL